MSTFDTSRSEKETFLEKEQKCKPPFAIILFSLVQLVFYYLQKTEHNLTLIFQFSPYCKKNEIWRYVTYMFVHNQKDHLHVWFNIMFQILLGMPLECRQSWWKVSLVYLAGIVTGAFGYSFFSPCGILVGASAGVFALLAAHLSISILVSWKIEKFLNFLTWKSFFNRNFI